MFTEVERTAYSNIWNIYIFYLKINITSTVFVIFSNCLTSVACCLRSATCAAMTRCLSTTSRQFAHWQSLHRQNLLCPFRQDTTPWFRHRAHFGVRLSLRWSPEVMFRLLGLSSSLLPASSPVVNTAWSSLSVSRPSTSISNSEWSVMLNKCCLENICLVSIDK